MTSVTSPMAGRAIGLAAMPGPVFAGAMVSPGAAVAPMREPLTAAVPIDKVIVSMHLHAFVVLDEHGHDVLTHLGIDTAQLNGRGFELLIEKSDTVKRGEPVVRWNPAAVESQGKSPVCPVAALEAAEEPLSELVDTGDAGAGAQLFVWS